VWTIYRILTALLSPLWILALAFKQRGALRLGERLGKYETRSDHPVWIQAVSLGEVRIALRLADQLAEMGLPVQITSTTATGLQLAAGEDRLSCAPKAFVLDIRWCVRRALKRVRPRALVLVETELWPILFEEANAAGVPVFIVNARLSDRAFDRTLRFKTLYGKALRNAHVAAQTEEHAARFKLLGAFPGRVHVLGNLKYDISLPPTFDHVRDELSHLMPSDPVWVAGSVREGEEDPVMLAMSVVRQSVARARLIMVPRHLNRAEACLESARRMGFSAVRRTEASSFDWDVLVLDTVGELWSAYSLGGTAFVGGSLVPLGGQNVLEPAFLKKPVLFGPHTENFLEDAERLAASGGGFRVATPAELGWRIAGFLADPALAEACGLKAYQAIEHHRGAVSRAALWLSSALPGV
jgi:3-deoxy-D-manno-octulosonic-acid transferase